MHKFLIFIFIFLFVSLPLATRGQSACTSQIEGKSRAQLEAELEACNREILEWTDELNKTKATSASYSRDVSTLTAKINAAQANINGKNIAIKNLSRDISEKEGEIRALNTRSDKILGSIADIIRNTNHVSSHSMAETVLSSKGLSEFFVDVDAYASAERGLQVLLAELRGTKALTEKEKQTLDAKRRAEAEAKAAIEAAKKTVEADQKQKKQLLAASQTQEKGYEQIIKDRQAKAAQIRATLFPLRDAGAIPFGTALQYAETASAKTGVRPALILGILEQESNLGANVGSCVISNLTTGETKSVRSGTIFKNGIHPSRDLPLLQSIVTELGRDPLNTRVSCPVSATFGYGGAMGPAQFIPSTWNIIVPSLKNSLSKDLPDPWNPADAIMASAILLRDLGAANQSYSAERNAACKYYSGRTCPASGGITSYGNKVMERATNIQNNMIDLLASS